MFIVTTSIAPTVTSSGHVMDIMENCGQPVTWDEDISAKLDILLPDAELWFTPQEYVCHWQCYSYLHTCNISTETTRFPSYRLLMLKTKQNMRSKHCYAIEAANALKKRNSGHTDDPDNLRG